MNSIAELTQKSVNPALPEWIQAQISALQLQLAERDLLTRTEKYPEFEVSAR